MEPDITINHGMDLIIIPDPGPGDLISVIHLTLGGALDGDIVQDGLV
jgi:hypothetical protein